MLKNPALAYMIGKFGFVASDTTNVCWNVESASFTSRDTLGKLDERLPSLPTSDLPASDASDVRFDVGTVNEARAFSPSPDDLPHPAKTQFKILFKMIHKL